jgi:hypothetical protein
MCTAWKRPAGKKGGVMTRKDEKDAERPHYYSQFWLDIAAGRRVIGGPKPEEAEASEPEIPESTPVRKTARASEEYSASVAEATLEPEVEEEEEELEEALDESELPNIVLEEEPEEAEGFEKAEEDFLEEEEPEEEEFFDEEEEEEEEEEDEDWSRRGRKKAKPSRPVKPAPKPKRSPRRGF